MALIIATVAANGDVTIYQGDDYLNADGRALVWTNTSWPVLTGATITAKFRDTTLAKTLILTKTGAVVSATSCRVDLTRVDTALFPAAGSYRFQVTAALVTSTDAITLVDGICTVLVGGGA